MNKIKYIFFLILLIISQLCIAHCSIAENLVHIPQNHKKLKATLTIIPLTLSNRSNITLTSPSNFPSLQYIKLFQKFHKQLFDLFGHIPKFNLKVRFMHENDFFTYTQAPSWTNAIYFKDEIIIPISQHTLKKSKELIRTIKHEYTHAVVNALSNGRCLGWLDEGIAQLMEGKENQILKQVLINSIKAKKLIKLSKLQNGFTKLSEDLVPTAYAQSLYITKMLIRKYGFHAFQRYFEALRKGYSQAGSFIIAFNQNEALVEAVHFQQLRASLKMPQNKM